MVHRSLSVIATTTSQCTHSLFDYESSSTTTAEFNVLEAAQCVREREGVAIRMLPTGQHARRVEHLCQFTLSGNSDFSVEPAEGSHARRLWLVVRDLPLPLTQLVEGDVIRLGRFEFSVRALVTTAQTVDVRLQKPTSMTCVHHSDAATKQCRICLMDGVDDPDADPLLAPCLCKGSIQHVHLGCLRYWLQGKLAASTELKDNSFNYVPPQCELCKCELPTDIVKDSSQRQPLIDLPHTAAPYIVLEAQDKHKTQQLLHVVSLADGKVMRVGRSHDSNVRVSDVSISRLHATIRFENGAFLLEDNKSKFGTLLALRGPRRIELGETLTLQSGRTLLSLSAVDGSICDNAVMSV